LKPLFGEGIEDVVLGGKVAVQRGGRVTDVRRNLAYRDVPVTPFDEQVTCGVENRLTYTLFAVFEIFALLFDDYTPSGYITSPPALSPSQLPGRGETD
jgi:hypothetical protein